MARVYLGFGSNLGDRTQAFVAAYSTLQRHPALTITAVSSLYHTAPVGFTDQDWFLNAVVCAQTTLSPTALLRVTQATERRVGRTPMFHWGPRLLDIDILWYDAVQIRTPFLTIPHAALSERLFVLVPLQELAPDLQLPSGQRLSDLIAALPEPQSVQKIGPFPLVRDTTRP